MTATVSKYMFRVVAAVFIGVWLFNLAKTSLVEPPTSGDWEDARWQAEREKFAAMSPARKNRAGETAALDRTASRLQPARGSGRTWISAKQPVWGLASGAGRQRELETKR
jgi:hypothetical protein